MNSITTPRAQTTERFVALAQVAAPLATGITAPFLQDGAAMLAGTVFAGTSALIAANYMGRLGPLAQQIPAVDIMRAHGDTLGLSALTTGMALGLGTLGGPEAADALMAGWMALPSVPGIVSLGWWAAVALIPLRLRKVLGRQKKSVSAAHQSAAAVQANLSLADVILKIWEQHICDPDKGQHRHQVLTDVVVRFDKDTGKPVEWKGRILAPAGLAVSVKKEAVSSAYRVDAPWIDLEPGAHAGEALITVNLVAPAVLDPATLKGAWAKRVARRGGLMEKTHLEGVVYDPNTEGESGFVVADDDLDFLTGPDRNALAGALRTSPLLVSYEPMANDPRRAMIRRMPRNPLEKGHDFTGLDSLEMTEDGRFRVGKVISGHPALLPAFHPQAGAQHLAIAGATGSGKGGAAQVVSLGYHANGAAILYADPKGSSNPAIPKMAAYSGFQQYGALGALRISYAILMHRKEDARIHDRKNFVASPMRPWCSTVVDEAGQILGPNMPDRKEAVAIVQAGTSLGRSFGMPWVLINQVINLEQIGGVNAIRINLIQGGSWLILRTDSGQTNLADLPPGFEGIDPGLIPAVWSSGNESLIYDRSIPEASPIRTFGLGYLATAGGRPAMMRIDLLEDATEHIRGGEQQVPEDFPDWDEGRLEEIANTPIPGFEKGGSGDPDDEGGGPAYTAGVDLGPKKEPTAKEKIVTYLRQESDPLHLAYVDGEDTDQVAGEDFEVTPVERGAIEAATGLAESTLANALKALVKERRIHRPGKKSGTYAVGPELGGGEQDVAA